MMRKYPIYQVDAFTSSLFSGNSAAVCPLDSWLDDTVMQAIAQENNLSETAFIVPHNEQYQIRWFTPNKEVALCGHATLASAFVLFELLAFPHEKIIFDSQSGPLCVKKEGDFLQMDFPALPYHEISPSSELLNSLNVCPVAVYESTFDLLLIFDNEHDVQQAKLDLNTIAKLPHRGVILSALANGADIYSRCFYPGCDVPEDPVTGSAHCVIAPYWCERLGKTKIHAKQGGSRQGELWCEVTANRVLLSGRCQLYLEGCISIPYALGVANES